MSDNAQFVTIGKSAGNNGGSGGVTPPSNIEIKLDLPVYLVDSLGAIADQLCAIQGELAARGAFETQPPVVNVSPPNVVSQNHVTIPDLKPTVYNTINVLIPWQVTTFIGVLLCGILAKLVMG